MSSLQLLHVPVLYGELLGSLHFFKFGQNIVVDCTLGLGGHARGVLQKLGKGDVFIGLDCDTDNLTSATERLLEVLNGMEKESQPTVYCIHSNFSELGRVIKNIRNYTPINEINESNANNTLNEINELTCIYADLGVSSVHFDTPERGFSFRFDGPLDMRLDSSRGETAADLINTFSYEKMAEIFRVYGDESRAGFIAKKIIEARTITPIKTTKELAEIVIKAWKDSLPRIFQALRIAVNDEYRSLETMLQSAHDLLVPGGTLSVIAFHSGEDRIVKHFLKTRSAAEIDPITGQDISSGTMEIITKKPITPTDEEIQKNPRARSALLRVGRKC